MHALSIIVMFKNIVQSYAEAHIHACSNITTTYLMRWSLSYSDFRWSAADLTDWPSRHWSLCVCSSVGSSMTFGHGESKQSAETSSRHQAAHLATSSGAGGSDHPKLKTLQPVWKVLQCDSMGKECRFMCSSAAWICLVKVTTPQWGNTLLHVKVLHATLYVFKLKKKNLKQYIGWCY